MLNYGTKTLKAFLRAEDGAVTVDWVVLTAAVIGMGMLVVGPVALQTDALSDTVSDSITGVSAGYGNN